MEELKQLFAQTTSISVLLATHRQFRARVIGVSFKERKNVENIFKNSSVKY